MNSRCRKLKISCQFVYEQKQFLLALHHHWLLSSLLSKTIFKNPLKNRFSMEKIRIRKARKTPVFKIPCIQSFQSFVARLLFQAANCWIACKWYRHCAQYQRCYGLDSQNIYLCLFCIFLKKPKNKSNIMSVIQ